MSFQTIFMRYEIKYLLTAPQTESLVRLMSAYMRPDKYFESTVCNVYYDTPDYLMIRRSIEKPTYKEKLRLRSYGIAGRDGTVFCELKKKCESVVYKRRLTLATSELQTDLTSCLPDTQIGREITYCFTRYPMLAPKVFICYDRQAYCGADDRRFRMTLDKNIMWRDYDLSLSKGIYGNRITDFGQTLLEVKTTGAMPLWLVRFLSENKIYKTSFSKYGNTYAAILAEAAQGGRKSA